MKKILIILSILPFLVFSQKKATLNGYVKDAGNGETLIGATVKIKELSTGNITNVYGFYSITLPAGSYTVEYSFVGFKTKAIQLTIDGKIRQDIELKEESQELEDVVITGEAEDKNITSTEMSVENLGIETIKKMPAVFGEVDVIKSIQLLPGVSSVGEGSSGFNVRGGGVGQNLVLLDEAPIYNSSHLFGFFSVFNPDAVKDIKLYKGGIPSRFGGRIASVLDIRMKEGNNKKYEINGGVGTVFSRLAVEGPIIKDKASFIIAGRRSYADVLARPFTDVLKDRQLYFYDLTAKTNWTISDKDRLFASGYLGQDVFRFSKSAGFAWGNSAATLRWNHLFNEKLFSNATFYVTQYKYDLAFGSEGKDRFEWKSKILTFDFKPEFTYFINAKNEMTFGGEAIYYRFKPADALSTNNGKEISFSLPRKSGLEYAAYVGNKMTLNDKISLEYGLRASGFSAMGKAEYYSLKDTLAGLRRTSFDLKNAKEGEIYKSYMNLEPRASAKIQLNNVSSIKASYNRTAQYIHLISNTTASNPLDLWNPSSINVKPQTGQQFGLGYFRNFKDNAYEFSLESYYRMTKNQLSYIDGASLFLNRFVEGDFLSGNGRAYGLEFSLKKNKGRFTGWVSYTLGKTELKIDGINYGSDLEKRKGNWFPTKFDQRHNLKIVAFYKLKERITLSTNFAYLSGTPTTFFTHQARVAGYTYGDNTNNSRGNARIPDYHRLDLSATFDRNPIKKNGQKRKVTSSWVVSVYNVYARKNPFAIYFVPENNMPQAYQTSILGSVFPAVAYNFKF